MNDIYIDFEAFEEYLREIKQGLTAKQRNEDRKYFSPFVEKHQKDEIEFLKYISKINVLRIFFSFFKTFQQSRKMLMHLVCLSVCARFNFRNDFSNILKFIYVIHI